MFNLDLEQVHINLHNLKNEIKNISLEHPVFIYIGVGAAAYSNPLPLEHYHQYPPFLQDMRNMVADLHIFLVLIDPHQESPPMVVRDNEMQDINQVQDAKDVNQVQDAKDAKDVNNDQAHYTTLDGKLQAFVYRHSVYTDADIHIPDNAINITETLRGLNQFAKENQVSLVYHDFTGRKTALLAEHFDIELKEHLDQVIYGMSVREDHGCFFDLTQVNAYFPFRLENQVNTRPIIKMFNYYKYINNNTCADIDIKLYPEEMHSLADIQRNQLIQIIRNQFKNTNLSLLRQIRNILLEPIAGQQAEQQPLADIAGLYMFNELPSLYRRMFMDLYKEKEYDLLYELLFNYSASQLEIMCKLKKVDMTGEELLTFITLNEDPYKWHNAINEMIL